MHAAFESFCIEAERAIAEHSANGYEDVFSLAHKSGAAWHPNGFIVFELGSHGPGTLRLHVWPRGRRQTRDATPHVHTHVWDLYSRVLVGRYEERMYHVTHADAADAVEFEAARIDYLRDRNTIEPLPVAHLRSDRLIVAESGESHSVRASEIHQTLIGSLDHVATLVIVSPPRLGEALIYSRSTLPAPQHARRALARDEILTTIEGLQTSIKTSEKR